MKSLFLTKKLYFDCIIFKRKLFQLILFIQNYILSKRLNKISDIKISKILIFRLQRLGDLLMVEPVIKSLSKSYPDASIDMITAKSNFILKPLFKNSINEFYYYNSKKYYKNTASHPINSDKLFNLSNYDLVIDFDGDSFSLNLAKRLKPKKYFSRGSYRVREFIQRIPKCVSQFELLFKIAELDIPTSFSQIALKEPREKIIEIHPYASATIKYPDDEFYRKLIARLNNLFYSYAIVLTGYGKELEKLKKLSKTSNIPIYQNPDDSLGIELRKRTKLVISPDTFTMHFAAHLKAKVIGLFGPQTPTRYAGLYPNVYPIYHKMSCSPCDYNNFGIDFCPYNKACMNSITIDEVISTVKKIIDNS